MNKSELKARIKEVERKEPCLSFYTVESVERKTRRIVYSNITATSVRSALRFEKTYFGEPFFTVLRAYPKMKD